MILTDMLPILDEVALQASIALLMEAMLESMKNPTRAHGFKAATEAYTSHAHTNITLPSTPQRLSELAWVSAPLIKRAEPTPPPPPAPAPPRHLQIPVGRPRLRRKDCQGCRGRSAWQPVHQDQRAGREDLIRPGCPCGITSIQQHGPNVPSID